MQDCAEKLTGAMLHEEQVMKLIQTLLYKRLLTSKTLKLVMFRRKKIQEMMKFLVYNRKYWTFQTEFKTKTHKLNNCKQKFLTLSVIRLNLENNSAWYVFKILMFLLQLTLTLCAAEYIITIPQMETYVLLPRRNS